METYISIIKYYPFNIREEFFGIGIIMCDDEMSISRFKFSDDRIKRINSFFGIKKSLILNETINNLKDKIFKYNDLSYLSKYENGTIRFSVPKKLNIDNFDEKFNFYFNLYTADSKEQESAEKSSAKKDNSSLYFKNIIRSKLKKEKDIEKHLNIAYTVKKEKLSNLMTSNMEIDFIGGNGSIFCGQIPNFATKNESSENNLTKTLLLYNIFKELYDESKRYDPKDCKIILNKKEKEKKENREIISTIEEWHRTEGYEIVTVENENQIIDLVNNEIQKKKLIPFDKWLELNPAGNNSLF